MAFGRQDKEIQEYRDLVDVPQKFDEGFGPKMIVGAVFLGFLMVPGSLYLELFIGQTLGTAARWVTIILFAEVARRSMQTLRQQEVFLLFYMTGIALMSTPFSSLLWYQYLVQSPAAIGMGVAQDIPSWIAPSKQIIEETGRTFFTRHWLAPIAFMGGMLLISRIDHFGLGYALYRLTAHVEKLPFPMAPVSALGITVLAESHDRSQQWRWRCFSLGAVLGLGFGLIYVGIPAITGNLFGSTVQILPIPWLDLTPHISSADFMPAVPLNIVFDAGLILLGMVLPFWAVVGGFVGLIATWILNPLLFQMGMLSSWREGMDVVDTMFNNTIDFYLSFGIGLSLAIFIVSVLPLLRPMWRIVLRRGESSDVRGPGSLLRELLQRNRDRGDISIVVSLGIYVTSTIAYIVLCCWLMPGDPVTGQGKFPWLFFVGFAFIYQPIISYVNAKLEGMVGQNVQIPLVRQAAFILSGYQGAAIWFAPIPMNDFSRSVQEFRVLELTGTRLSGIIKVELITIPIVIVTMLLFTEMIWRLGEIPGDLYPFTQKVWHLNALHQSLTITSTMGGSSMFLEALKFDIITWGLGTGVVAFVILTFLNLPTFLVYGAVRGMNQTVPGGIVLEMIGALIGQFYFRKKFGPKRYKQYVTTVFAGFSAGMGLIAMASIALALLIKSTTTLRY